MGSPSTMSLLAGLVGGYTQETGRQAKEKLDHALTQRDQMIQYMGHLAANPNVPPEHQQWALGKIQELIQADPSKKLPKIDLNELPPVSVQRPERSFQPTLPAMTLQPPQGPGAGQGASQPPAGAPGPNVGAGGASQEVGRQAGGPVNALGALKAPMGPPVSPEMETQAAIQAAAPTSSLSLPATPQARLVNPQPPVPISPGGLHLLTPQDKAAYAQAAQEQQLAALRQQFPGKSEEELAYYSQHGDFPKAQLHAVAPGAELVDERGKVVAHNTEPRPGEKSGYSYERGPGGEVLVKDNRTGATLSAQQIAADPQAKAVYDTAKKELGEAEKRQDERDATKMAHAERMAAEAFERATQKKGMDVAAKGAKDAKAMVDVLDTSEEYMAKGQFSPRQDLALIVRAVRAMNPGTVRLPQKELELELKAGSYGDRFKRWFDTASNGTLPDDQREDLMRVIRSETTRTATSAAENWRESFKGTREEEPPTYLRRFEKREGGSEGPGQFTATDPDGGIHTFPDRASRDRFQQKVDEWKRSHGGAN